MVKKVDVIVIGAGPGGYPAAIRAAQLGKSVLLIDKGTLGGECLNWGCIPSKAIISASEFYHRLSTADAMGIKVERASIDMRKLQEWKQSIQTRLIGGIIQLLKSNKVEYIEGTASFLSNTTIEVIGRGNSAKERLEATNFIIASGAEFLSLPGFEIDENTILSAKGTLSLDHVPENFVIIGGGVVGMELGIAFRKLGSKVTVVELLPEFLPGIELGLVRTLNLSLKKLEINMYKESKAMAIKRLDEKTVEIVVDTKEEKGVRLIANKILLSIGKRALTSSIGLEKAGVKTDPKGFITVDKHCRTNISNIFAVGDCTGTPFLAHRATKQGIVAAEVIAGQKSEMDFRAIPGAVFTDPEIAFAGFSEEEAIKAGYQVKVGRTSFAASGRALSHQSELGYVKVIADRTTDVILGIEIVGPNATDLISEAALAIEMGATLEDLGHTVHPHPTLPELMMEAAELALGKAIHFVNQKKESVR